MKVSPLWSILARQFSSKTNNQQLQTIIHQIRFVSQHIKPIPNEERQLCYTIPNGNFTFEQRQFYEDNGFIIIRKLISPSTLERFRQRFDDVCAEKIQIPGLTIMKDIAHAKSTSTVEEKTISRIQDFTLDDEFFQYCCLPELIQCVENFTGPNIMSMHTMMINKPPDAGKKTSRHPLHQDLFFFPFRPANRIVCAWTAMEHTYRENGCLVVLPGTHKGKIEQHVYPNWKGGVNKLFYGIENFDPNREKQYVEMWEGDTIFFHPLLIHGSGTNRTSGFRKIITSHFADSSCYYIECEDFQKAMENEYLEIFRKRTGRQDATIQDLWKHRSRLIQGKRINL
ncbi:unnamed protein product [Rotaria sordida]|uniref:phytanoyl-CoA dioxygenase n=1 Tax=Rotaria sordida TaxID=392033 RepID=A0A813MYG6_9BILA|nr:unnamed protein product [Rotaria sordida]CAF1127174.1 unnamed protein product [Rotaria sordida]